MGASVSTTTINIEDHSRASVATTTVNPVAYAPNYYDESATNRETLQEISISTTARPCNTNRIMAFHSKACWSGYFEASKAFPNLVVISFTNMWYEPCRQMETTFNEFAAKYTNVEFVKIDVDELNEISQLYGVRTTPTYLFIKKGKEIDRVVNARKEEIRKKIEKHT